IAEMADASVLDMVAARRVDRWDAIRAVRTPLVAAVSGFCLGGGCELAMSCDLIVASETAVFGQPETALGLIPGAGGTPPLRRAPAPDARRRQGAGDGHDPLRPPPVGARGARGGPRRTGRCPGGLARRGETGRSRDRVEGAGREPAREGGRRPCLRRAVVAGA